MQYGQTSTRNNETKSSSQKFTLSCTVDNKLHKNKSLIRIVQNRLFVLINREMLEFKMFSQNI